MKKVLLLATGGTIACRDSDSGLVPALGAERILPLLDGYCGRYLFDSENLMDLDSSNIQPEQWRQMARRVYEALPNYHAVIITHGTDTLAYTASALSFMLDTAGKSVVITGSQLPVEHPLTDAGINLCTAMEAIDHGIAGVSVAFDRKIIRGTRVVKVSTMGFDAFESINAPLLGQTFADGTRAVKTPASPPAAQPTLRENLCTDVFILKLLPGTRPEIFDALVGLGYRGIVVEAFGAGGLHFLGRNLLQKMEMALQKGISIVVCSQCLYERCDMSLYEVGRRIMQLGVIPGRDMTTEAAATKLMWCLGQTEDRAVVHSMFNTCYAGEVTLE